MPRAISPNPISRRFALALLGAAGLGLSFIGAGRLAADDPLFLRDVEDLPLAPGLQEDVGAGVYFDKPGGRIVEAVAFGAAGQADAASFYRETLPALGWAFVSGGPGAQHWRRGGENLRIELAQKEGQLVVHFSVAPQ